MRSILRPLRHHLSIPLGMALAASCTTGFAQSALAGVGAKPTLAEPKAAPVIAPKTSPAAPNAQARSIIIVGGKPKSAQGDLNPQPLPPKKPATPGAAVAR